MNLKIVGLIFYCYLSFAHGYPSKIPVASFTVPGDREQGVISALNYTVNRYNHDLYAKFKLSHHNRALRNAAFDTWGVMKKICAELQEGLMVMLGGVDGNQRTFEAYNSIANTIEIPFVNWDLSVINPNENVPNNFEVSVRPPNHELVAHVIVQKRWDNFIYLHDGKSAPQNLQLIHNAIQKVSNMSVKSELIKIPTDKISMNLKIVGLIFYCYLSFAHGYPSKIPVASFTVPGDREQGVISALNYTVNRYNHDLYARFKLSHHNRALRNAAFDTWGVMKKICAELQEGLMVMLAGVDGNQRTFEAYNSIANTIEIPFVNWDLSAINPNENVPNNFEVSLRPPNHELVAHVIVQKRWDNFIYLHDGKSAPQNLQLIHNAIQKVSNMSVKSELIKIPTDKVDYGDFLRNFNLRDFPKDAPRRVVIDITTSYKQQQFLVAIRGAQFNQQNYHYLVINFDFLPYDVEMFQNGNINITGFQIIDKEAKEYSSFKKTIDQSRQAERTDKNIDLEARLAFVHDAVLVAKRALELTLRRNDSMFHENFRHGLLFNRGFPGIACHPQADKTHENRPFSTFEHGKVISRSLRDVRLDGSDGVLTGNIEFDRLGFRKNFAVTVVDLTSSNTSSFNQKDVCLWKQNSGFSYNETISHHVRKPIDETPVQKLVRVTTVLVNPFVMIKRECVQSNSTECQGNNRYEGYCVDLLVLLSERIPDLKYEINISEDKKPGNKLPDGTWDGMVGKLLNGEADMAVSSLTINSLRERVVDFSKPFMTTGISIMIKKPDKQDFSVFSFLQPLSGEIWLYIIFAYISVSVVIFIVSRFSPYEWRVDETSNGSYTISNDFSIYNCLWMTAGAFMQQGTDIVPRSISGRIASVSWWFFSLILISSYTANLAAFLTLEKMKAPIESVEDLAKQTRIKYGIQHSGSTAQFFKYSSVETYSKMYRYMESQVPSVFVSTYGEGIEKVRSQKGRYAFLLEATANDYENTRKPCDTIKVGNNLNSQGYGIATPFGSEWKDHVNLAILALQERGELKKLENKWWFDRGQCEHGTSDNTSVSLNLSKVAGIFYILMGGMILSMVAASGEFLYRSRLEARKGHISSGTDLKNSLYGQLKLSCNGGAIAKEGMEAHDCIRRQKAASFMPASGGHKFSSGNEQKNSRKIGNQRGNSHPLDQNPLPFSGIIQPAAYNTVV
uniref:PBPe domain-containing protein n=1 Tax=Rhabditophanes sp. KR3021 TaxID=114890 RepID=A0AC35UAC2_9BILA